MHFAWGFFYMNDLQIKLLNNLHKEWIMLVCKFGERNYAEDLVQETYIKIITSGSLDKAVINGVVNKAFMYVALRNNVIDFHRSKGKIYKVEISDRIPEEEADMDRHQALDILDKKIQAEIKKWHWYDRDMFLHYMNTGKSQREIAKGSNISLSSISNTIVNCKNRIRNAVGDDLEKIQKKEYNLIKYE